VDLDVPLPDREAELGRRGRQRQRVVGEDVAERVEVEKPAAVGAAGPLEAGIEAGWHGEVVEVPLRARGLDRDLGPIQVVPHAAGIVDRVEDLEREAAVPRPSPAVRETRQVPGDIEAHDEASALVADRPEDRAEELPKAAELQRGSVVGRMAGDVGAEDVELGRR